MRRWDRVLAGRWLLPAVLLVCALLAGQVGAAELSEGDRGQWLARVAQALAAERVAEAVTILDEHPADAHYLSHLWRGRVAAAASQWPVAAEHFRAALALRAAERDAAEGLLDALAHEQNWSALVAFLPPWLMRHDGPLDWWQLAALAALEDGDGPLAEIIARQGLLRFPGDRALRRALAQALAEQGAAQAAAAIWWQIIRQLPSDDPQLADHWLQLALVYRELGQATAARRAFSVAHSLDAANPTIADHYTHALLEVGHHQQAWAVAQTMSEQLAGQALPVSRALLLARAGEGVGQWSFAHAALEQVAEPQRNALWRRQKARLAALSGDHPQALDVVDDLVIRGEASPDLRLWAAQIAQQTQHWSRAEAHLRDLYTAADFSHHASDDRPAWQLLHFFLHRQRLDEAMEIVKELLEQRPHDQRWQEMRAYLQQLMVPSESFQGQ